MRLLLALAVMVVALVAWLSFASRRSDRPSAGLDLGPTASSTPAGDRVATELDIPIDASAPTRIVEQPVARPTVAVAAVAAGSACRVFGRVVDDLGAPIAGARIVLQEWGEFPAVTVVHETISANSGGFGLEIAGLTSAKQSLSITAKPFHITTERWFGDVSVAEGRRLAAGEFDVGTIELMRCGTVEGRVVTDAGVPVGDVGVLLKGTNAGVRGGTTDQNGMYSIPEVLPGRCLVTVQREDWLPLAKVFAEVDLARVTVAPDVVLTSTPTIEGTVVDAGGTPIPGVTVHAENSFTHGTTNANGEFAVRLLEREPATLSVLESCAYHGFGGRAGDPSCTFEPGARGVRIVIERVPTMTFRVIDAATRAPIERFGLWIACYANSNLARKGVGNFVGEPTVQDHPGGTVAYPAGFGARVTVTTPGRAPVECAVVADASSPNVQTIALLRGSSVTGRVLVAGRPAVSAKVNVVPETSGADDKQGLKWSRSYSVGKGWNREFEEFERDTPDALTDASGAFTIGDLAAGTYMLGVNAPDGARTILRALVVLSERVLALGDVEITPAGIIRGVVRTGPEQSPIGCTITTDDFSEARVAAADGRFELGGLAPGRHFLVWSLAGEKRRQLDSGDPRRIDFVLSAGETREIVIDAARFAPCAVTVRVVKRGMPLANAEVELRSVDETAGKSVGWDRLGRTNDDGVMTGSTDGGRRVRFEVYDVARHLLGWSWEPADLVAGGRHESTIDVLIGKLVVELPSSIERPEDGRITVFGTGDGGVTHLTAYFGSAAPKPPWRVAEWSSETIDFGDVSVRVGTVHISFERFERDTASENPKGGNWIEIRKPFSAQVEIKDGETTRVVVP